MVQLDGGSGDGGGGTDGSDTTSSDISGIFGDPVGDTTTTDTSDDGGGGSSSFDPSDHLDSSDETGDAGDDDGGRQIGPGPGDDGPQTASGDQTDTGGTPVDQGGDDPAPDDVQDVETGDFSSGQLRDVADQFEQQVRDQTGQDVDFGAGDVEISGDRFVLSGPAAAALSREQARETGRDLTESGSGPFSFGVEPGDPALESGGLEIGTGVFGPAVRRRREPTDISGLELGDVLAEQRQETREDLERRLEAEVGTDLQPGDIEFEEEDGQITATLTEAGERSVQVDRAPIVGAAETLGLFEPQARSVAGAAVTFREFGQEQRERFVKPSLQSLREATGLESEIQAFESLQDQATAAEEEFLRPARETVSDQVPAGLAAGAVAVGTRGASLTPPGRVAVGAALATGAAADVFEDLPPEQQLEIATAVGTASAPVSRAQQTLTGPEVDSPTVRAEIPSALPGEFDAPEQPEPIFDPELPATPGPFFVSELDVPLGRPTLQEIPVGEGVLPQPLTLERPDDPTEGAAGRAEVPIDIEDGEVSVGPAEAGEAIQRERSEPTVPADPMGETVTGRELEEATGRIERQRQIEERLGRRQQGVEVGEGVVLQRLREDALAEQLNRLDAATAVEVLSEPAPAPMPAPAASVADVTAAQVTDTAVQQDITTDFDLDTRIDTRFDLPTVQTTEFARPVEFAEPTLDAHAFETAFGTGVTTPRAPGEIPIPAISLDGDDPRRRARDIDEFEREFLEPVISPEEALEADRGGPEAMDFSDDMT